MTAEVWLGSAPLRGAARDTLAHAETVADRELAAAVDNPVVLADGRVESNGNFHGAPLGYVLDFLASRWPTSPASPSGAPT